jgi:glutamyl-Q tRNA(Asp) synthetase
VAEGNLAAIGRFAPSPTGPLHLGSLCTAVASYVDARSRGGRWLVRIEDLDRPRCVPGAVDLILRELERHALHWDGTVLYQHERLAAYRAALEQLHADGVTYRCTCSRSQLPDAIYPGYCRSRPTDPRRPHAVRVVAPARSIAFLDLVQGNFEQRLDRDVGDFVVFRRDGIIAYQLAVVVDDIAQQITHVVRGADLLDNTPRQLLLFEYLHGPAPDYAHIPVLVDRSGRKLSKQTRAQAVDAAHASDNLALILSLLQHAPPSSLRYAPPAELLRWAIDAWDLNRIPPHPSLTDYVCI